MNTTVDNVVCAACGLVCENVSVRIENGAVVGVEGACSLCEAQLLGQTAGEPTASGIDAATEVLCHARAPLIYGLAGSSVETQRAAVSLADRWGATIDPALPAFHRATLQAVESVGTSTSTLGEIKQRADVVLFWGADPTTTHPRLFDRFLDPTGRFVSGSRFIMSVSAESPRHRCDEYVRIPLTENLTTLAALRAILAGRELGETLSHAQQLRALAERLQNAEYSVIFFGPGIGGPAEIDSLLRLVKQLNARSRCAAIGLSGTQCENVLTWQSGYPCAVNFALGYPRYDPDRYSASAKLERGEVDAVLLIGSEGLAELSASARAHLVNLPVALLEYSECRCSLEPTIRIALGRPGVQCGGTVFRMDGVPIRLRPIFDSPLPTAESILTMIQQGVCASCD